MQRVSRPALVVVVLLSLVASGCWKPSLTPDYSVTVTRDVVYGQGEVGSMGSSKDLTLDLYTPKVTDQDQFPLIVAIHGGGFTAGSKEALAGYAQEFADRGYIVAAINYRLVPDRPVPSERVEPLLDSLKADWLDHPQAAQFVAAMAAIDDTLAALDYLHSLPEVDPSQTVLTGSSAGAIVSAYVAYALDDVDIERPPVAAAISNWGGLYFNPGDATAIEDPATIAPGSGYSEGPIYMAHATGDSIVPYSLATDIADRADDVGLEYRLFTLDQAVHGFDLRTEVSPGVSLIQDQINWLNTVLPGVAAIE